MKKATQKAIAGVSSLFDPSSSEFWAAWVAVAVKLLGHYFPPVMEQINTIAGVISDGQVSGQMMLTGLFAYAALRMTSKAAKERG